ncbi:hypothetical protein OG293_19505 [Streptomyces sp. NBC_00829]|nr:hypothetical protein OG293_19505 [Streptomyces sp. NBC_00829]
MPRIITDAPAPPDDTLPEPGLAEVRIVAASPDVARKVAQALRAVFASTEQRSYPAGDTSTGTRLHLTVDTTHTPRPPGNHAPPPSVHAVRGARRIW